MPPATTGELCPSPTGCRQTTLRSPFQGLTSSADGCRRGSGRATAASPGRPGREARPSDQRGAARVVSLPGHQTSSRASVKPSRDGLLGVVQERVQRGVAPAHAVFVGQFLQPAQVRLGDGAGLLVVRVAVVDAAAERPRLAGRAQVVLAGTGRSRPSPRRVVGRRGFEQHVGLEVAQEQVWPYSLNRQQRPLATHTGPAAATSRSTSP